jgi:DNA-binding transcriptional ArsR family regulator
METRRDVFQAIADPTRREIIQLLAKQTLNLNAIAGNFDMSRPAISQHIKLLAECGLVVIKQQGRERYCEARLEALNDVSSWAAEARKIWLHRFAALEIYLEELKETAHAKAPADKFSSAKAPADKNKKHKKHGKKK